MASTTPKAVRRGFQLLLLAFTLLASTGGVQAQDAPLDVFGYFQAYYGGISETQGAPEALENSIESTFALQQVNLFFNKRFSNDLTALVNFEVKNAFSTDLGWGAFNIDEAWVSYRQSRALSAKAGLLVPTFNNLNEIKNRTPLLPYVLRPLAYEESLSDMLDLNSYVPERAYLQLSGSLPFGPAAVEYAAYVGNSEIEAGHGAEPEGDHEEEGHGEEGDPEADGAEDEHGHEDFGHFGIHAGAGTDETNAKMFGGRVGLKYANLRVGVSATQGWGSWEEAEDGRIAQRRLGGDLSFRLGDFTLEGEAIHVAHDVDELEANLDKLFYYGSLNYDITDQVFSFVTYGYIDDQNLPVLDGGLRNYSVGAGFRPTFNVVLKTQYSRYDAADDHGEFEFNGDYLHLAVSVLF